MIETTDDKTIAEAWHYVTDRLFWEETELIYDHVTDDLSYFPTKEEAEASFPNPCGYGTGMEDSMINGGSMLLACVGRYRKSGDEAAVHLAHRLVSGILRCQRTARSHGFLPRSVTPRDGVSHYIDSSRDQYTLCIYGIHVYLRSGLATPDERADIAAMLVSFAERAEKNVTPENGFDLLREDGMPSLCNVMWGDTLGNHEFLRLPMIYLAAWEASGDAHWFAKYQQCRDEAIERSLPMTGRYWHLYTLQQMQMSARLCYDLESDEDQKASYLRVMQQIADYVANAIPKTRIALDARDDYNAPFLSFHQTALEPRKGSVAGGYPNLAPVRTEADSFFVLQDAVDTLTVLRLCPERTIDGEALALYRAAVEKIDFSKHVTSVPVQMLEAYYTE